MGGVANGTGANSSYCKVLGWALAQSKVSQAESEKTLFTPDINPTPFFTPQHLRLHSQSTFQRHRRLRSSTMAQLSANGESDRTDSPLSVEAIEESFRTLRLTPGLTTAIIQALINISTSPTATQTPEETVLSESDDVPNAIPLEAVTTPAGSRGLSPTVTTAPIAFRDAVSTLAVPTPIDTSATIQTIVAPAVVSAPAAPIATPAADAPAADVPVAVPPAAAPVVTPAMAGRILAPIATGAAAAPATSVLAPNVTLTTARPTLVAPVVATPIVGTPTAVAPTSTTAPVVNYHLPAAGATGPYYCITRGRDIGVYAGWEHVSPLVIGVSRAVFGRVDSIQEGRNRMDTAESAGLTARL
ncbi:hypothetical protein K443DRAFT_135564 [Laccaria amethystina LaAM-08-1]|uniref:Ribonuclease H1 N-terminal domain-containing protein n=1 Tax=Laccaria amethystina LaAM-08-1 TaxID=1095629 RepID=A0A0C9X0M2_9AGAR|nr:hypothetical protein K443DRAFT_135564 [Laccaria amethystina LaAM-08-1]